VAPFADGFVFVDDLLRPNGDEVPGEAGFTFDDEGELARVALPAVPVDKPALGELVEFPAALGVVGGVFEDQLCPEGCFFGSDHCKAFSSGCLGDEGGSTIGVGDRSFQSGERTGRRSRSRDSRLVRLT
jgi:hypothetical protein